jgi:type IV pilus assembly protein PilB
MTTISQKDLNISGDVVKIVDNILLEAINSGASDIHLEPTDKGFVIRHRVDGIMRVASEGDGNLFSFIGARIKILGNLETTGRPRPQEGNIKFIKGDINVDLRVSVFPTSLGEAIVIRILESEQYFSHFEDLGFTPDQSVLFEKTITRPYGLILVTGPNGSGKSTTLFTVLNKLNDPEKSLVTLEDPVERKIKMVRQTNIDPEIGLTFADGLRYLLRQDPDVIMVGEIRDTETAKIAVEAAITGHLVLATIHTNNAAGAIVRLIDMGIEPFLLATALKFVSAQRLARTNCPFCRKEYDPPKELIDTFGVPEGIKLYRSAGCDDCGHKGLKGRQGIHEVFIISEAIENMILRKPSDEQINAQAVKEGMMTLRQAALQKAYQGDISLEEALRLTE